MHIHTHILLIYYIIYNFRCKIFDIITFVRKTKECKNENSSCEISIDKRYLNTCLNYVLQQTITLPERKGRERKRDT